MSIRLPRLAEHRGLRLPLGAGVFVAFLGVVAVQARATPISVERGRHALAAELAPGPGGQAYPSEIRSLLDAVRAHVSKGELLVATHRLEQARARAPDNATLLASLGRLYLEIGRPNEAVDFARRAAERAPDWAKPWEVLGRAHLGQGRASEAAEMFTRALERDPALASAHVGLAQAHLALGQREKALSELDAVLAADPLHEDALLPSARLLVEAGRHAEAIRRIEALLRQRPEEASARVLLAEVQAAAGSLERAEQEYKRAIEAEALPAALEGLASLYERREEHAQETETLETLLVRHPERREAREHLVKLYQKTGRPALRAHHRGVLALSAGDSAGALRHFREALERDANLTRARLGWARAALEQGDAPAAKREIEAALSAQPGDPSALTLLGEVRWRSGETERAEAAFREALRADAVSLPAQLGLARLLQETGRYAEGAAAYARAAELAPRLGAASRSRGDCHAALGQFEEAEVAYRSALVQAPGDVEALVSLYLQEGRNLDLAIFLANHAVALRPDDARLLDTLGRAHYRAGHYERAGEIFEKALGLVEEEPAILFHLGAARFRMGDLGRAREAVERALGLDPGFAEAGVARELLEEIEDHDSGT